MAVNNTKRSYRHRQFSKRQNLILNSSSKFALPQASPCKSLSTEASPGKQVRYMPIHDEEKAALRRARPSGGAKFERRTNLGPISVGSPPELSPNTAKPPSTRAVAKLSPALQGAPSSGITGSSLHSGLVGQLCAQRQPALDRAASSTSSMYSFLRVSGVFFFLPGLPGDEHGVGYLHFCSVSICQAAYRQLNQFGLALLNTDLQPSQDATCVG